MRISDWRSDVCSSDLLIAFILLFPIFFFTSVLFFLSNKGSVFFLQDRPGRNGKIFKVIKFKTMNDKKDAFGNLLPDASRLTAIGRFVRKISLDEIPQLLNVIKGDMSLIGPRPRSEEHTSELQPLMRI